MGKDFNREQNRMRREIACCFLVIFKSRQAIYGKNC